MSHGPGGMRRRPHARGRHRPSPHEPPPRVTGRDAAPAPARAANSSARAATAEGAGVPEYLALAAALTRLRPGDDDGGRHRRHTCGGGRRPSAAASFVAAPLRAPRRAR